MNRDEKYLARIIFKGKLLQADGQTFQDLFVEVMTKAHKDFHPIKPHGNKGDRKNDGFIKDTGTYYQCYAPEQLTCDQIKAKLKDTFEPLVNGWKQVAPVQAFNLVLNDRFKGCYPEIEDALADLERKHSGIKCKPFLCKDLEDVFLSLSEDNVVAQIGLIPNPNNIQSIEFSVLEEVIGYLVENCKKQTNDERLVKPDFERKLTFNGLSPQVAALLRNANYQVGTLEEYFDGSSSFVQQDVRDCFVNIYNEASSLLGNGSETQGDLVFAFSLSRAMPKQSQEIRDSVLVLMSFYFEVCDIFETPPEEQSR